MNHEYISRSMAWLDQDEWNEYRTADGSGVTNAIEQIDGNSMPNGNHAIRKATTFATERKPVRNRTCSPTALGDAPAEDGKGPGRDETKTEAWYARMMESGELVIMGQNIDAKNIGRVSFYPKTQPSIFQRNSKSAYCCVITANGKESTITIANFFASNSVASEEDKEAEIEAAETGDWVNTEMKSETGVVFAYWI
ncbi:hypothetical protein ANCDUO_07773 [Ancylostoma duodenale]|uniref:Uncharacterized protein n=1 Tax=Ancylostoma duodenale TaxID=51022 RepID=A0A0C2GSG6_9BILA|nr:hypothetical protein ANCDUO_07773 [Ancylostoma duodenale]